MNCEPKKERYMPHKIEPPPVAVKALGDNELADWVERIASAPNIGLLDEYKGYLRECAMRMKERGERLRKVALIAGVNRITREVKRKGLRLYIRIDGFSYDLDTGEVVKSLNSLDTIYKTAGGK